MKKIQNALISVYNKDGLGNIVDTLNNCEFARFAPGDKDTIIDVFNHVLEYLNLWEEDPSGLVIHRPGDWDCPGCVNNCFASKSVCNR